MPGTDSYGQNVPYPKLNDAPNLETAMAGLVNGAVPLTNMTFANANARAAQLATPVVGMETYLVAEGRKEIFTSSGWVTITAGPWIPLSFASGYAANSGSPAYRIVNQSVRLRGTAKRTSGSPFTKAAAFTIATLPVEARPTAFRYFLGCTEWASDMYARVEIDTDGSIVVIVPTTGSGTAASWVSLDQVEYSLV